jgi:hypothetical protein
MDEHSGLAVESSFLNRSALASIILGPRLIKTLPGCCLTKVENHWSKAWIVFGRSKAEIVGSNPIQGMDVSLCVYSVFVLPCVSVAALRQANQSSKGSYRLCKKDNEIKEEARAQQRAVQPLMNEWNKKWGKLEGRRLNKQVQISKWIESARASAEL